MPFLDRRVVALVYRRGCCRTAVRRGCSGARSMIVSPTPCCRSPVERCSTPGLRAAGDHLCETLTDPPVERRGFVADGEITTLCDRFPDEMAGRTSSGGCTRPSGSSEDERSDATARSRKLSVCRHRDTACVTDESGVGRVPHRRARVGGDGCPCRHTPAVGYQLVGVRVVSCWIPDGYSVGCGGGRTTRVSRRLPERHRERTDRERSQWSKGDRSDIRFEVVQRVGGLGTAPIQRLIGEQPVDDRQRASPLVVRRHH